MSNTQKPVLGILLGDASGVGPELIAKTAASGFLNEQCRPVIIGDMRVFENACRICNVEVPHYAITDVAQANWEKGFPVLDQKDQDPATVEIGKISVECGAAVLNTIDVACELCKNGDIEGFAFAPFNKSAMIEAGCEFESEHHLMANIFGITRPFGEINMLGNLMTTRTTSHIPISAVSQNLTEEKIGRAIQLSWQTCIDSGIAQPKIGVAALNPHCGENGRCGREELDVIAPAIQTANDNGIHAVGPFSADILFIKAFDGDFDAVVTMYHDQGQIALKLKGFDQGITVAGGQPYPIATCAHGTAYDIAGKNLCSTSAFENSVKQVARMALHSRTA